MMFTQPGFREDYRIVCRAVIGVFGRRWRRRAVLLRWDGWREIAWGGANGLSWPECVHFENHPRLDAVLAGVPFVLPESRLPRR